MHQLLMFGLLVLPAAIVACSSKSVEDGNATAAPSTTGTGGQTSSPMGTGGAGATSGATPASNAAGGTVSAAGAASAVSGVGGTATGRDRRASRRRTSRCSRPLRVWLRSATLRRNDEGRARGVLSGGQDRPVARGSDGAAGGAELDAEPLLGGGARRVARDSNLQSTRRPARFEGEHLPVHRHDPD